MMSSRPGFRRIIRMRKRFVDKYDKKYLWVLNKNDDKVKKIELGWFKEFQNYLFNIFCHD